MHTVKYVNLWGFCCRRRRGCLSSLVSYKVVDNYETARLTIAWITSMLNCNWPTKNLSTINRSWDDFPDRKFDSNFIHAAENAAFYSSYLVAEGTHSQVLKTCDKIQR